MTTFEAFQNGNWVPFYPLNSVVYGDMSDTRPTEEILKQETIYGKAIIGSVGYSPAWMYGKWKRDLIRIKNSQN